MRKFIDIINEAATSPFVRKDRRKEPFGRRKSDKPASERSPAEEDDLLQAHQEFEDSVAHERRLGDVTRRAREEVNEARVYMSENDFDALITESLDSAFAGTLVEGARDEGAKACAADKDRSDNPYEKDSDDWHLWNDGYSAEAAHYRAKKRADAEDDGYFEESEERIDELFGIGGKKANPEQEFATKLKDAIAKSSGPEGAKQVDQLAYQAQSKVGPDFFKNLGFKSYVGGHDMPLKGQFCVADYWSSNHNNALTFHTLYGPEVLVGPLTPDKEIGHREAQKIATQQGSFIPKTIPTKAWRVRGSNGMLSVVWFFKG